MIEFIELIDCIQIGALITMIIAIICIYVIYLRQYLRKKKLTYEESAIILQLKVIITILAIIAFILEIMQKKLEFLYILNMVCFGISCIVDYVKLKKSKNDMNQHDEKEDKKTISSIEEKN